jgi:hypothetical protein
MMIALLVGLMFFVELASAYTTPFPPEEDDGSTYSPESLHLSEKYARVMKKMTDYCEQPYSDMDDKIIDMYTLCFSNLLQAVSTRTCLTDM